MQKTFFFLSTEDSQCISLQNTQITYIIIRELEFRFLLACICNKGSVKGSVGCSQDATPVRSMFSVDYIKFLYINYQLDALTIIYS